jgi:hypothetical protein
VRNLATTGIKEKRGSRPSKHPSENAVFNAANVTHLIYGQGMKMPPVPCHAMQNANNPHKKREYQ